MGLLKSILEPLAIAAIFTIGAWVNREDVPWYDDLRAPLLKNDDADPEQNGLRAGHGDEARDGEVVRDNASAELAPKRYKPNIQSRILARFPFIIEIFYWLLIYWIYQGSRAISARVIAGHKAIFDKAEHHALSILSLESTLSINIELPTQQFVLKKTPWLILILAQIYYSHIILGVAFLVYSYTFLARSTYKTILRTLALCNGIAFIILSLWRCAPPRLLPEEYGFIDVLHNTRSNSDSAWTQNKFQLTIAAMPSLHFGGFGLFWPVAMGATVVATANHFIMDMGVGVLVVVVAWWVNWGVLVLLPVERGLFGLLRLVKPPDGVDGGDGA
ncbi:hypothetical protein N7509_004006 [Penicillium cosmopolitanum]|uniref:Inositolphosphotransferase Aur1/Ipt1 domain-containing protein n=1 Tax=Penicillium cosmopolitanum TaxID=1131564 RepID=A0A9W9W644_9EURO|nr:uncharacterized protein N7509_004006 [Penicillium cosmopolitanum]KAJ5404135.1 hypothetical protein N7509_004006 [Penicillium cosmopolitanum]